MKSILRDNASVNNEFRTTEEGSGGGGGGGSMSDLLRGTGSSSKPREISETCELPRTMTVTKEMP